MSQPLFLLIWHFYLPSVDNHFQIEDLNLSPLTLPNHHKNHILHLVMESKLEKHHFVADMGSLENCRTKVPEHH